MKTKLIGMLNSGLIILLLACSSNTNKSTTGNTPDIPLVKYEIFIDGMTCAGCEQTIQTAVSGIDGFEKVTASHEKGNAIVEVQDGKFDTLAIKSKISESGYTVTGFKTITE